MRTTITITSELLQEMMNLSGKKHFSEAIVTSLKDYSALKKRLGFLDILFKQKIPHSQVQIKKQRKKEKWS